MTDPGRPDNLDLPDDNNKNNDDDNEEITPLTTPDATATIPDQPLSDPLPYGTGFATPQQFGYGVAPQATPSSSAAWTASTTSAAPSASAPWTTSTAVAKRERSGSPILAVAGLLSMGVAVWAILGAPVITTTVMLAAGLVVAILVGLVMVVRR